MKIDLVKLSEDRESILTETWDPLAFDLNGPGLTYRSLCRVEGAFKKEGGLAKARVSIKADGLWTCARCFKEFQAPVEKIFNLAYSIDLEQKVIFVDDDIRQELILEIPQKVLCQKDCKGLCLKCGTDLNNKKCKCQ